MILRADLPLGVKVAQTIHAAGESSPGNLPADTRAVALAARDEAHLLEIEAALTAAGMCFSAIREPDPPWSGALMAIGISPQPRTTTLRQLLGKLPLLK